MRVSSAKRSLPSYKCLKVKVIYALIFVCLITYRVPRDPASPQGLDINPHISTSASKPPAQRNPISNALFNPLDTTMKDPRNLFVDKIGHQYQALTSHFLLGNYSKHEGHAMDAVIIASAPDSAMAACVHNLYHLQGFRRFIFVVNDAKAHCHVIFDLVPQHGGPEDKKHICLEHSSFYTDAELQRLWNENGEFKNIHDGPPEKVLRAGKYINNPRMGCR